MRAQRSNLDINMINPAIKDKLVLALDFHDPAIALEWVAKTRDWIGMFKVGGQLFTQAGPPLVREILRQSGKVFLDLKFHDIPNTVAACGEAALDMGVTLFNVHASGGLTMMQECLHRVNARANEKGVQRPVIFAVTVLTSINQEALSHQLGCSRPMEEQVLRLARLANEAGLDGVVCSPREIAAIRAACPPPFKILTPGIRNPGDPPDDQQRTLSPAEACALGADYLVLGRTVTAKADPVAQLERIHFCLTQNRTCNSILKFGPRAVRGTAKAVPIERG